MAASAGGSPAMLVRRWVFVGVAPAKVAVSVAGAMVLVTVRVVVAAVGSTVLVLMVPAAAGRGWRFGWALRGCTQGCAEACGGWRSACCWGASPCDGHGVRGRALAASGQLLSTRQAGCAHLGVFAPIRSEPRLL